MMDQLDFRSMLNLLLTLRINTITELLIAVTGTDDDQLEAERKRLNKIRAEES